MQGRLFADGVFTVMGRVSFNQRGEFALLDHRHFLLLMDVVLRPTGQPVTLAKGDVQDRAIKGEHRSIP